MERWGSVATLALVGALSVHSAAWAQFDVDKFQEGSGAEAADLHAALAALIITIAMAGVGWIWVSAYRAWADGDLSIGEVTFTVLRACLVLAVLGFFIR